MSGFSTGSSRHCTVSKRPKPVAQPPPPPADKDASLKAYFLRDLALLLKDLKNDFILGHVAKRCCHVRGG